MTSNNSSGAIRMLIGPLKKRILDKISKVESLFEIKVAQDQVERHIHDIETIQENLKCSLSRFVELHYKLIDVSSGNEDEQTKIAQDADNTADFIFNAEDMITKVTVHLKYLRCKTPSDVSEHGISNIELMKLELEKMRLSHSQEIEKIRLIHDHEIEKLKTEQTLDGIIPKKEDSESEICVKLPKLDFADFPEICCYGKRSGMHLIQPYIVIRN